MKIALPLTAAVAITTLGLVISPAALAQADARVEAGLWEVTVVINAKEQMAAQMKEVEAAIAQMPKEQQEQMRAMLAQQMKGAQKMTDDHCVTPEDARKGVEQIIRDAADEGCQQTSQWLGKKTVRISQACPGGSKTEHQINVISDKKFHSVMKEIPAAGDGPPIDMSWTAVWKSASCGNAK
ncbi:MAG: DUF3617 family protein [Burkholderiaceae bacterium]